MLIKRLKFILIAVSAIVAISACSVNNGGSSGSSQNYRYVVTSIPLDKILPAGYLDLSSNLYFTRESGTTLYLLDGLNSLTGINKFGFTEIMTPIIGYPSRAKFDYARHLLNLSSRETVMVESQEVPGIAGWIVDYESSPYSWKKTFIGIMDESSIQTYTPFAKIQESLVFGLTLKTHEGNAPIYSDLFFSDLVPAEYTGSIKWDTTRGGFDSGCTQKFGEDYITSISTLDNNDHVESLDIVAVGTELGGVCLYSLPGHGFSGWHKYTPLIESLSDYKAYSPVVDIKIFDEDGTDSIYFANADGQIWSLISDDKIQSKVSITRLNGDKFINSPLANSIVAKTLFIDPFTKDVYIGTKEIESQLTKIFVLPHGSNTWQIITLPISTDGNAVRSITLAEDNKTIVVSTNGFHAYYINKIYNK